MPETRIPYEAPEILTLEMPDHTQANFDAGSDSESASS